MLLSIPLQAVWLVSGVALLTAQAITPAGDLQSLLGLGIGGALAVVTMRYYREDRKASEERYAALAQDFRKTVIENTTAIVQLRDMMDGSHTAPPAVLGPKSK